MKTFAVVLGIALGSLPALAQFAVLEVDAENIVSYTTDIFDATKFASDPNLTTIPAPPRNFAFVMAVGDIVAVNGRPARGTLVVRQQSISLSPSPALGQGVADIVRTAVSDYLLEIQQADGTLVGNIHCLGLSAGTTAVGAPVGSGGNLTVAGGTGAFVGARGQMATSLLPGGPGPRTASITEDPAKRRGYPGGGRVRFTVQLIPMSRPEVIMTASGPAIAHSSDFSLVSTSNPAKTGEILSLFSKGLGPTRSPLDAGQPFPANPLAIVNSPVQVTVNGKAAEVVGAVGFPGSTDTYQVNFRVPADTTTGASMVQLSAAWIAGDSVQISVN
ncbi:MAG TPA: hypothetical protein VMH28_25400 [Candidatus Acidoferrales bacterium]|nr:hypothetical protein [Candidatus Acidoferrales bacterium]